MWKWRQPIFLRPPHFAGVRRGTGLGRKMGAGGGGERGGLTPPIRDKGAGRSNPYLSRLLDFCFCAGRDSSASAFCGLAANSREPIRRPRMLYGADGVAWVGSCRDFSDLLQIWIIAEYTFFIYKFNNTLHRSCYSFYVGVPLFFACFTLWISFVHSLGCPRLYLGVL